MRVIEAWVYFAAQAVAVMAIWYLIWNGVAELAGMLRRRRRDLGGKR